MRDVIPMVRVEDKWFGIEKLDWAAFLGLMVVIQILEEIILPKSVLWWICSLVIFVGFEYLKVRLERKEQSLFRVLFEAACIPDRVVGVFHRKVMD